MYMYGTALQALYILFQNAVPDAEVYCGIFKGQYANFDPLSTCY